MKMHRKHTAWFLIYGRHARIFGQVFDHIFARIMTRVCGQGFWDRKYIVQYYRDGGIQFYSSTGTEKYSFAVLPGQKKKGETTMY